jgi:hypothetical protein
LPAQPFQQQATHAERARPSRLFDNNIVLTVAAAALALPVPANVVTQQHTRCQTQAGTTQQPNTSRHNTAAQEQQFAVTMQDAHLAAHART